MAPPRIGKYAPIRELGVGAMGMVYLCSQPGLERPVAVKVMIAGRHASPEQILRFQREAWAAAQLSHPNVLQIYDVGREGMLNYFVMEYVDGPSLDGLIGTPELTLERALRLVAQVARALHAAHARGIIHRDIKPSNILINREDQPKLADFGLAKSLHDSRDLSGSGDIIGTPRYMSPEQALAVPTEIDHRTDIYSLGAVMYEMLSGSPPIDGSNPLTILRQLIDEDPVPLRQRNPAVPEEVAAICERAIARDKDDRYSSAAELAEDIEAFLVTHPDWDGSTYPTRLRPVAPPSREALPAAIPSPRSWWRRRPIAAGAAAIAALTLLGLAVAIPARSFLGFGEETDDPVEEAPRPPSIFRQSPAVAVVPKPAAEGKPAGRKAKGAQAADSTARALAMARELLHSGGSQSLAGSARPKDRIKSLLEDLNVLLKANPESSEVRFLRGRAYRRAGEMSSAMLDFSQVLRREPKNLDARTERLLAGYQLHVLYLGNLSERILRPIPVEDLDEDLKALIERGDPVQRHMARMVEALARQDYDKAGTLAEGTTPTGATSEDLPDVRMIEADALFHLAEESYRAEQSSSARGEAEADRDRLRERRQALARRAITTLRMGLDADPDHVGLLFLRADTLQRVALWETSDDDDQAAAVRRQRLAFDAALDRLRNTALIGGCDHAIARTVLLYNFGRESLALDRVNDALSCQPAVPYVHTLKAWLRLMAPSDGLLTAEDVARIQTDYQAAFDHPDDANSYFVRALLHAAAGRSEDARSDLRACRRILAKAGKDALPTSVPLYNDWFVQANSAPLIRYIYATSDVVAYLPVVDELKIRLAENVLKKLDDPQARKEGISEDDIKGMKGWTHYRLAVSYAAQNNRQRVLEHVRAALALKRPDLSARTFREDASLNVWNNDAEFAKLYEESEKS
jgi:serine/threonine protein kinase